jgi:RNA 2',3'-cyclic 3'-phosphodiesterase
MRLFVAVRPPRAALRELDDVLAPLRVTYPRVLWSDHRDWHVTLAFLGEVPGDRHEALSLSLAQAARRSPGFPLRLAGGGQFGSRVLWIGLGGDLATLHHLADQSRMAVDESGVDRDQRPLQAHLTVGRGRRDQRGGTGAAGPTDEVAAEIRALSEDLAAFRGTPWNVDRMWLMSVHPRQSPRYGVVASWELRDGGLALPSTFFGELTPAKYMD